MLGIKHKHASHKASRCSSKHLCLILVILKENISNLGKHRAHSKYEASKPNIGNMDVLNTFFSS